MLVYQRVSHHIPVYGKRLHNSTIHPKFTHLSAHDAASRVQGPGHTQDTSNETHLRSEEILMEIQPTTHCHVDMVIIKCDQKCDQTPLQHCSTIKPKLWNMVIDQKIPAWHEPQKIIECKNDIIHLRPHFSGPIWLPLTAWKSQLQWQQNCEDLRRHPSPSILGSII